MADHAPLTRAAVGVGVLAAAVLASAGCRGGADESGPAATLWLISTEASDVIGPTTTEADLVGRFGGENVQRGEIALGEGDSAPGSVLFPGDPARRLEIVWHDAEARARPALAVVTGDSSLWAIAPGIRLGSTLAELEEMNGRPFAMAVHDMDHSFFVTSWREGRLAGLASGPRRVTLTLEPPGPVPPELSALAPEEWPDGDETELLSRSSRPRRLAPRVTEMSVYFETDGPSDFDPQEIPGDGEEMAGGEDAPSLDPDRVPASGARTGDFLPAGWRVMQDVRGDLNGDRRPDAVLHLAPASTDEGITSAPETHALLVLLAADGGYRRAGVAPRLLVPVVPQYGLALEIRDGVLITVQNYGMSSVTDLTHRIRMDPRSGTFLVVEREQFSYTRPLSRDDTSLVRENYEAGERVTTTGHVSGGVVVRESTSRERIPPRRVPIEEADETAM